MSHHRNHSGEQHGPHHEGPGPEQQGPGHHEHDCGAHHHHDEHHHHHGGHHHHHGDHGHEERQPEHRGGDRPGPKNVDLELSQMLGDHATGMTRDIFMEVLKDSIKEELKKMPELQTLVSQAARELSEDIRLSLQIEELIAQRDKKRETRKSDLLAALLKATSGQ